jgi:penicillin-binding protein 1A
MHQAHSVTSLRIAIFTFIAFIALAFLGERLLFFAARSYGNSLLEEAGNLEGDTESIPIYGRDDQWLGTLGERKSFFISLDEVPKHVIQAVLAAEDHRFFHHAGISYWGILRAFWHNLQNKGSIQGASTITQQLVRLKYLSSERTLLRKLKEACMALALEQRLNKQQILEEYVNRIYLGQSAYGIEAAARNFFRKTTRDLSIGEAAMIVGSIPAPSLYNPHRNLEVAKERQQMVLKRMRYLGWLEDELTETVRVANAMPLRSYAPFYIHKVEAFVDDLKFEERIQRVNTNYVKDPYLQRYHDLKNLFSHTHMAYVRIDSQSGAVLNLESAQDFAASQFDYASESQRPLGTAITPFIVALALDRGMQLEQSIYEEHRLDPDHSLHHALKHNRVEDLARVYAWLGAGTYQVFFEECGFSFPRNKDFAIALGRGLSHALELAAAFSIFLNDGFYNKPSFVESLTSLQSETIYKHPANIQAKRVLKNTTSQLMAETLGIRPSWHRIDSSPDGRDLWIIAREDNDLYVYWLGVDKGRVVEDQKMVSSLGEKIFR